MRIFSKQAKTVSKEFLRLTLIWLLIAGGLVIVLYTILFFLAVNLVDVKLIVSLSILEIPLAVGLSYILGDKRRNKVQDAIERLRATKEFAHLRIHRVGYPLLLTWYYVENLNTNCAYDGPAYLIPLADEELVETVDHKSQEDMEKYFISKGVIFENRRSKASELA